MGRAKACTGLAPRADVPSSRAVGGAARKKAQAREYAIEAQLHASRGAEAVLTGCHLWISSSRCLYCLNHSPPLALPGALPTARVHSSSSRRLRQRDAHSSFHSMSSEPSCRRRREIMRTPARARASPMCASTCSRRSSSRLWIRLNVPELTEPPRSGLEVSAAGSPAIAFGAGGDDASPAMRVHPCIAEPGCPAPSGRVSLPAPSRESSHLTATGEALRLALWARWRLRCGPLDEGLGLWTGRA